MSDNYSESNINITAAAWLDPGGAAAWHSGSLHEYGTALTVDGEWRHLIYRWFKRPPRNFGRFPPTVKAACGVVAMMLRQLDLISLEEQPKRDIGILGFGFTPTHEINRAFFRDYIDSGRVLGRGNFFIYTLPSSALAEVSIFFGLTGPSMFVESEEQPFCELLKTASSYLIKQQTRAIIGLWLDTERVAGLFLQPGSPMASAIPLTTLAEAGRAWLKPTGMIDYFKLAGSSQSGLTWMENE